LWVGWKLGRGEGLGKGFDLPMLCSCSEGKKVVMGEALC